MLWCRPSAQHPWAFELLLTDIVDGRWRFKRDARITLPREGKILLRGTYVSSRSSGVHRIHGAAVEIN